MTIPCPAFMFVNPQLGENLGSVARGMRNFGLHEICLIAPRDGWLSHDAIARACGASSLLERAAIYTNIEDALAKYQYVYATTGRVRDLWKPILSPDQAMKEAAQRVVSGARVAVMFGCERTGLTNNELTWANSIISIPTVSDFKSINLAHSAVIIAYEWQRHAQTDIQYIANRNTEPFANQVTKRALVREYIYSLEESGYFQSDIHAESRKLYLRNFLMRLDLTVAEVKTLHRIRKSLSMRKSNRTSE